MRQYDIYCCKCYYKIYTGVPINETLSKCINYSYNYINYKKYFKLCNLDKCNSDIYDKYQNIDVISREIFRRILGG